MLIIFWQTIKDRKKSLFIYCLVSILFLWMYVGLYPAIGKTFSEFGRFMESFPKGFLEALGIDIKSFFTFEGFIGSEQFTFVWPIMAILLLVSFSSWSFAGEIDKGTIETLLSQPLSRFKIFLAKYLAGLFNLLFFVVFSVGSIFPLCKIYDISISNENFLKLMILEFLFGWVVFSIAVFISVIFSGKNKANFISGGILLFMYIAKIASELKESLDRIKYISLFYYLNPVKLLVYGEIDKITWLVFSGVIVFSIIFSIFWFKKRDVAI